MLSYFILSYSNFSSTTQQTVCLLDKTKQNQKQTDKKGSNHLSQALLRIYGSAPCVAVETFLKQNSIPRLWISEAALTQTISLHQDALMSVLIVHSDNELRGFLKVIQV